MCRSGEQPERPGADGGAGTDAVFTALLEDSAEELYEAAPCGYLSTLMDGTIAKINATLLRWLGLEREDVVGRLRFADLLTVGGKLYHETHFAPLPRMRGELGGIALEMRTADGGRLPVLPTAPFTTAEAVLSPGDTLLLYTDGLTEARTGPARDSLLGDHALRAFAAGHAPAGPGRIIDALAGLLKSLGDGLDDDTALLALGVPATHPHPHPATDSPR